jgi:wyosine [tRNA(Phe)-imidazoG37] synthetase (radical SAM superfamily)
MVAVDSGDADISKSGSAGNNDDTLRLNGYVAVLNSIVYGPVPSRRLGFSLGINNIPPKICSYSCCYCQLGKTIRMQVKREHFYRTEEIAAIARDKIKKARENTQPIDYITFVAEGEPTLDLNLGSEIEALRDAGLKIAVITNASLITDRAVKQDLQKADWVSLKVDAYTPQAWRKINRPAKSLRLEEILQGIAEFCCNYNGKLATETMLIKGINDSIEELTGMAAFLGKIKPNKAYLAIPIRPPAEQISPADEETINTAYHIFSEKLVTVEYLIGYEGNAFSATGNTTKDLLSITAVHPMREDAVINLLKRNGESWELIEKLIYDGYIKRLTYLGNNFFMRKLQAELQKK